MKKTKIIFTIAIVLTVIGFINPREAKAGAAVSNQSAYRWRDDDGDEAGASWLQTENNQLFSAPISSNIRIRIETEETAGGNLNNYAATLQYSTNATACNNGTWTTLDTSTTTWQISDSPQFTGPISTTTSRLTTSSMTHVAGQLKDTSNTAANVTLKSQSTEHEWSIQGINAAYSTTYRFRTSNGGSALNNYGACAILETEAAPVTYTQNDWRFYVDDDTVDFTSPSPDPWPSGATNLAENQSVYAVPPTNDPIDLNDEIRLRMSVTVGMATLAAGTTGFTLQYGEGNDCANATYSDVAENGAGSLWEFASSTPSNNASISATLLSNSDRAGRYQKSNTGSTNPATVLAGEDLEWDWHLLYVGPQTAATYCFKMRTDAPADLDSYNSDSYPQIDIRPSTGDFLRHGNFFTSGTERGLYWVD